MVDRRVRAPAAAAGKSDRCDILGSKLGRRLVTEDSSRGRVTIAAFRRRNQRIRMTNISRMMAVPPTLPVTAPATRPGAGVLLLPLPFEPVEPLPVADAPGGPEPDPGPAAAPGPEAGESVDDIKPNDVDVAKVVTDELNDRKPVADPFKKAVGSVTFVELLVATSMLLLKLALLKMDVPISMSVSDFGAAGGACSLYH